MDSLSSSSLSSFELSSWERVLDHQIGSLWGLVPCPLPAPNTTVIHYYSDLYIDSIHTFITLLCGILLLLFFSGVQKVTMRGTLDTMLQILPCFRDLDYGATSNTRFVLYYFCSALGSLIALLSLVLDAHEVNKAYRIVMQVAQRVFSGAAAVLLTIALNHQREHRHMDSLHGSLGIVQLVGQIRRINYSVITLYTIYIITEIITNIVSQTHTLRIAMAAISFVVIIVLNVPIFAAALWLALHKGHVNLQIAPKLALLFGITFRFLGTIDPSFWNRLAMPDWVASNPCVIGGDLAFYNLLRIFNCLGQFLLISFVVSEFRRSRSIVTQESSLIATAQYDDFDDDHSSNPSEGDLQRSASAF